MSSINNKNLILEKFKPFFGYNQQTTLFNVIIDGCMWMSFVLVTF